MKINRIISFANAKVRLQFLAMERSLRATGCDLPLQVIPYDETQFSLPKNAEWIEDKELFDTINNTGSLQLTRKFLALTLTDCAYFDSDIIHLHAPDQWLAPLPTNVFIVADTEYSKAKWTFTDTTKKLYKAKTTLWLLNSFNSGFFAYSNAVTTKADTNVLMTDPEYMPLTHGGEPTGGEQAGANFLVYRNGIDVINLCLPPYRMESTMACDYPDDFEPILRGPNSPAFIHYAGPGRNLGTTPITRLIFDYLSKAEAAEMKAEYEKRKARERRMGHWPIWVRVAKRIVPRLDRRFCIQWNENQKK